ATIGDTSPLAPVPKAQKNGCGGVGQILLVAIAVVVATIVTAGVAGVLGGGTFTGGIGAFLGGTSISAIATTTAGTVAAGAVGGAVGSIVSQGVGVATGIQDKFSWNAVAMAGLQGGIGAGLGTSAENTLMGKRDFVAGFSRGVASSILSQGIGVATGLQDRFSWAAVAASGVGGGVSTVVASELGVESLMHGDLTAGKIASHVAMGAAGGIANAATRSLIEGTDFGDNILAALPSVIGNTIGDLIARGACFVAGTAIHTPDGLRPIEDIRVGDWV
ncbi:hypothetical protein RMQ97_15385, partial [Maricaulis sp. D1M11]